MNFLKISVILFLALLAPQKTFQDNSLPSENKETPVDPVSVPNVTPVVSIISDESKSKPSDGSPSILKTSSEPSETEIKTVTPAIATAINPVTGLPEQEAQENEKSKNDASVKDKSGADEGGNSEVHTTPLAQPTEKEVTTPAPAAEVKTEAATVTSIKSVNVPLQSSEVKPIEIAIQAVGNVPTMPVKASEPVLTKTPVLPATSPKLTNLTSKPAVHPNLSDARAKAMSALMAEKIPDSLTHFDVPGLTLKAPQSMSHQPPSQIKQIESSIYEETSEFKSANVIRNSRKIELNKIYEASSEWMTFTIDHDYFERKNKFHLIVIKGSGTLYIRTEKKDQSRKQKVKISLDSGYEMTYVPINTMHYLSRKGDVLQLKIETGLLGMLDTPEVKIDLVENITMEFNQNHRIIAKFKQKIPYKVVRPDLHLNKEGKDDRLQFILQSSLNDQKLNGNEEISMYINRKEEFPSQSRYDFMATGNMGYGVIKSLHKGNANYCIERKCDYYISIYSENVDILFFFPTVFANNSKLKFHNYLNLLEEIEGNEIVSYELEVPLHEGDWAFIIQPIEGYPRMYINPDEQLPNVRNSKYRTLGEKAEQVTVTFEQSKTYGFSHTKFYVSFVGSDAADSVSSFKFEVKRILAHTPKFIRMNYSETGVVANKEIVQYKLRFDVDEPELINFEMSLTGAMGRSMLIIKECEHEGDSCVVTQDDVSICQLTIQNENDPMSKVNKMSGYVDDDLHNSGRMLQQGYVAKKFNGIPKPKYQQQAQNGGYVPQNQYYNPYETDYNGPANANNNGQVSANQYAQQNAQYNQQQQQQYSAPTNQYAPQYNPSQATQYTPRNNYNGPNNGSPQNNPGNQQYYRDMPETGSQNFATQDMVSQGDIKQAEREEQNYMNSQARGFPPNQVPPRRGTIDLQAYKLDNNLRPISPNQQNLTTLTATQMERQIADPVFGKDAHEMMNTIKDKELEHIQDYENLAQRQSDSQDFKNTEFQNLDKQLGGDVEEDLRPLPDVPDKPKGYEYDLKFKLKKDKLKCVEANGKKNHKQYRDLYLDFNCIGVHNQKKGTSFEQLDNRYPFFTLCQFAVGVFGNNQAKENLGGSFYSIHGKGGTTHHDVALKKSKEFIVEEDEKKYLRFDLKDHTPSPSAVITAKVVAITGSCEIYFSKFNKFPSSKDNEASMNFSSEHFMSVRTSEKSVSIPFDTWGSYSSLFVTIFSSEYCVLDFYVEKLNSISGGDGLKNEKLNRGKMVKRKITQENFMDTLSTPNKKVFARSFYFEGKANSHILSHATKVTINSNIIGLKLCLQRGNNEYNPEERCDIDTETGVAVIPNLISLLDPGSDWAVGVILEIHDQGLNRTKLPVEFSIVCSSGEDSKETLEILNPGRVFDSHLTRHETIIFKVNLLSVDEKSLIILTSEDKSVKGEISMNKKDFARPKYVLNAENFAVELNHMEQDIICENYTDDDTCIFFIRVSTKKSDSSRFSLTYTVDDIPITLKQGNELFIPNKDNMYFLYDPNPLFPAEFNLESDFTQFVVYAKLLSLEQVRKNPLDSLLTELKYDFKTDISREEQLRIPQVMIQQAGDDAVIAYLVAPKFDRLESEAPTIFYKTSSTTRIHVKSKMSKLDAYVEGRAVLNKGEFRHFYFNVDNEKDFSIIMTVQSGKADIYLNKGLFNLPTLKSYWKRSIGSKGEELAITKQMFSNPGDIKGVYTAGIFAKSNCRVAVVFLPSFDNLIKIKPQQLVNMKLRKDQDYFFEFFNELPVWDLDLFAENSNLQVAIMDYSIQKNKDQDLVDMIKDDSNYHDRFSFVKGALPLKHREDNAELKKHYVIKVKAASDEADLNLLIYEPGKPILIPAKKHFTFVGNKKESYIFKTELAADFEKVKLGLKMNFGKLDFSYSNDLNDLVSKSKTTLSLPVTKNVEFVPPSKPSDIELFNTFYLKVDTKEFSKFSVIVRGSEKFMELKPFQTEIVHTNPNEEQNVYFYVSAKKKKTIRSITIDINTVNFFSGKPKFYFNPDNENEMELGDETKLLPMPINDMTDKVSGEFRHMEVRPAVENGYYIVTIPKSNHRLPVKISIGINHRRSLEVNGVYRYQLPARTDPGQKFSMFLPEKGEFRFLIESCKKVHVNRAELNLYSSKTPIIFQENLVQASHFIMYDDTNTKSPQRMYKNYITRVFRGVNESPGVLNFVVDKRALLESEDKGITADNKDFLLVTEFKPDNRDLFFKDYVNLWGAVEDENKKQYGYEWSKDKKHLEVRLFVPQFRQQLLIDYPDLKKIVIKFFVYVFADEKFVDRLDLCGLAAVEEVEHVRLFHTEVVQVQTELNNKKPLIFKFREDHLRLFAKSKKLNVFSYMSISFFENELEEFEVGLEMKFANVPYFLFITNNLYGRTRSYAFFGFVLFCVLVLVGFLYYLRNQNKMDENDVRRIVNTQSTVDREKYSNPNESGDPGNNDGFVNINSGPNQIQISEMSSLP